MPFILLTKRKAPPRKSGALKRVLPRSGCSQSAGADVHPMVGTQSKFAAALTKPVASLKTQPSYFLQLFSIHHPGAVERGGGSHSLCSSRLLVVRHHVNVL
jgi:hypothetical protein